MRLAKRQATSRHVHVPVRTCAGCRQRDGKPALVRVARTPEATVVDISKHTPGRGTYVHRDASCIDRATRRGGLARHLRASLSPEETATLRRELHAELSRQGDSISEASAVGAAFLDKGQS